MFRIILGFILVAILMVAAEEEITENCIPYRGYCVTSGLPCCWMREEENGLVQYFKTTCDFMLRTCNVFSDVYKFNETAEYINRNTYMIDLEVVYNEWLESLQQGPSDESPDELFEY